MSELEQRIAILGATGHVGKVLTSGLAAAGRHEVVAVARDEAKLDRFLATLPHCGGVERESFERTAGDYDVVINCVGIGDPAGVTTSGATILQLTEQFDEHVTGYLDIRPEARVISFSSGAAYLGDFEEPVSESSLAAVPINGIRRTDYYGIAKLASEARHRGAADRAIVDLRLFGLFSRFIDPLASYFMNDVYRAIAQKAPLEVGPESIHRDYVDPDDLVALVTTIIDAPPTNDVYDVYSLAPAEKFELLDDFASRYGLSYHVRQDPTMPAATGVKPYYYSTNRRASGSGYLPTKTSIQSLTKEIDALLETRNDGAL